LNLFGPPFETQLPAIICGKALCELAHDLGTDVKAWDTKDDVLERICHIRTHAPNALSPKTPVAPDLPTTASAETPQLDEECEETEINEEEYDEFYNEAVVDCYTEEEVQSGLNIAWNEKLREVVEFPFQAQFDGEQVTVTGFGEEQPPLSVKVSGKEHPVKLNQMVFSSPFPKGYKWLITYL